MNSTLEAIRQPYGSFDGRFPTGIVLTVQSSAQWDVFAGRRTLSSEEIEQLAKSDQATLFSLTALATTIEHERRHFHDFMLSPLGSRILAARLSMAMNALQVFTDLIDKQPNVNALPLPLTKWIRMSPGDQERYLDSINRLLATSGAAHYLIGPKLSAGDPHFQAVASASRAMDLVASALTSRYDLSSDLNIGLVDVAESSALVVQAQGIWTWFGEPAVSAFINGLLGDAETVYGRMTRLLLGLNVPYTVLGALTTWALLGAIGEASPAIRFSAAATDLLASGCAESASSAELFSRWDKRFGTTPIPDVMRRSLDDDAELLKKRREIAVASDREIAGELADYFESYCIARRKFVHRFLADPGEYTEPLRYRGSVQELPEPIVIIGGTFDSDPADLEASGIHVLNSVEIDGQARPRVITMTPGDSSEVIHGFDMAQNMLLNFLLADAIVSEATNGSNVDAMQWLKLAVGEKHYILRLPL